MNCIGYSSQPEVFICTAIPQPQLIYVFCSTVYSGRRTSRTKLYGSAQTLTATPGDTVQFMIRYSITQKRRTMCGTQCTRIIPLSTLSPNGTLRPPAGDINATT